MKVNLHLIAIVLGLNILFPALGLTQYHDEFLKSEFAVGEIKLTCGFACAASWHVQVKTLLRYYEKSLWQDIQELVAKENYQIDMVYYLLGRSAEGLGQYDAAIKYYQLAIIENNRCFSGVINTCGGLTNIPAIAFRGFTRNQQLIYARNHEI